MGNNVEIELVRIFVEVVRQGSFTGAGESLRLPKSTVSKAVARLEETTGTKLLLRTTRRQTLTAAGKAFYDSSVAPLRAIEDAYKSLSGNDSLLTGTIRLTAPEDLGTHVLAPATAELTRRHAGLSFELVYTDQVLDLVKDGIDLAVRIGFLKPSGLKVKKIGEVRLILVASPAYMKATGKLSKPEDLKSRDCLALTPAGKIWYLRSSSGSTAQVSLAPRVASNQMSSLIQAAVAGAGVALVPAFLAHPFLESGQLTRVLPQWTSMGLPVSLLSPLAFSSSARLRTAADFFLGKLQSALEVV